ncbi:putative molybdenum cofactor guanylyltransferase [Marinithermofilum abyssi]|uniref:Probable molybdenum cofactor guanylyltransferase n=1 Tax=Marinithermofilum abyssi TaxID=1571185 RepID=A0A8J2VI55_9BACL|nr:molybdenum cofactor guanylyltransferase [Marinithermofilum abyssi]GGE17952.1 putative molybdenum cofactor guanylyltransferase [Marinithermofilum abyssi]
MDWGLILLAGGASRRMGQDKALLSFCGETCIERILRRLPGAAYRCLVVRQPEEYERFPIPKAVDRFPGKGPLAGIQAGLEVSPCAVNLVAACDMPFVSEDLAMHLLNQIKHWDAVVPHIRGRAHPLFAVYDQSCLPWVEEALRSGDLRAGSLLKRLRTRYVKENEIPPAVDVDQALFNMNHPADYQTALRWLKEKS